MTATTTGAAGAGPTATPNARRAPGELELTGRALAYWRFQYRRTWRGSVVSSLLSPALYLSAMGFGLGGFVRETPGGGSYLAYLAPGLLASTAFQTATFESMYPVMAAMKWIKTYVAQVATPLTPAAVFQGHLAYIGLRGLQASGLFLVVGAALGGFGWSGLLCLPVAVLSGLSVASVTAAFAASRRADSSFAALQRFVVVPTMLFAGVFYPVSQLPPALQGLAWLTPPAHAVALCRAITQDRVGAAAAAVHVAYLLAWLGAGVLLGRRVYEQRLAA